MNQDYTPEEQAYIRALQSEGKARDIAFLCAPDWLCGVQIYPLALRHVIALDCAGSPFLGDGGASVYDVAMFLWVLSRSPDELTKRLTFWGKVSRYLFMRRIKRNARPEMVKEIREWVKVQFQDKGTPPERTGPEPPSYFSPFASHIDYLALEYGWTEREILNLPMNRILQYERAILSRRNPDAIQFNPSDKLRGPAYKSRKEKHGSK